jgi:hypothetical protein
MQSRPKLRKALLVAALTLCGCACPMSLHLRVDRTKGLTFDLATTPAVKTVMTTETPQPVP